jgi:hypothetical protein
MFMQVKVALLLLLLLNMAHADKVILRTGKIIEGTIVETGLLGIVKVEVDGLTYEIDKSQIERIVIAPRFEEEQAVEPVSVSTQLAPPVSSSASGSAGVLAGIGAAVVTGGLLSGLKSSKIDNVGAQSAQARANLSASFGGESRSVDPRLYESEENRFSAGAIVGISAAVGFVVSSVVNAQKSQGSNRLIQPYVTYGQTLRFGLTLHVGNIRERE